MKPWINVNPSEISLVFMAVTRKMSPTYKITICNLFILTCRIRFCARGTTYIFGIGFLFTREASRIWPRICNKYQTNIYFIFFFSCTPKKLGWRKEWTSDSQCYIMVNPMFLNLSKFKLYGLLEFPSQHTGWAILGIDVHTAKVEQYQIQTDRYGSGRPFWSLHSTTKLMRWF